MRANLNDLQIIINKLDRVRFNENQNLIQAFNVFAKSVQNFLESIFLENTPLTKQSINDVASRILNIMKLLTACILTTYEARSRRKIFKLEFEDLVRTANEMKK